jgi:hypothetical protein
MVATLYRRDVAQSMLAEVEVKVNLLQYAHAELLRALVDEDTDNIGLHWSSGVVWYSRRSKGLGHETLCGNSGHNPHPAAEGDQVSDVNTELNGRMHTSSGRSFDMVMKLAARRLVLELSSRGLTVV